MSHQIYPDEISSILEAVANEFILPRFNTLTDADIHHKEGTANDLVSIADQEAEDAIETILEDKFPGSIVIGEESVSSGKKNLSILNDHSNEVWVVDPVDGTQNFVNGIDKYALLLAYVINGKTQMGWIYDIPNNRMMFTEQGNGVFVNGQRKEPFQYRSFQDSRGLYDAFLGDGEIEKVKKMGEEVVSVQTLSCAGIHYFKIIDGHADFSLYKLCMPWDHLAGTLAIKELGGDSRTWKDEEYQPQSDYRNGIVTSVNSDILHELNSRLINTF